MSPAVRKKGQRTCIERDSTCQHGTAADVVRECADDQQGMAIGY
jgi:hypothetical protein